MTRPHRPRRRSQPPTTPSSLTPIPSLFLLLLLALLSTTTLCVSASRPPDGRAFTSFLQLHEMIAHPSMLQSEQAREQAEGQGGGAALGSHANDFLIPAVPAPPPPAASPARSSRARDALDLQSFPGALGGIRASNIRFSEVVTRPFLVDRETFPDFQSASDKACDTQRRLCDQAAAKQNYNVPASASSAPGRSGKGKRNGSGLDDVSPVPELTIPLLSNDAHAFSSADCEQQQADCAAAQRNAPFQTFDLEDLGPDPMDPDYELLCAP